MEIKNILIIGSGTLGSQIGFECAAQGFKTVMYDISEDGITQCKKMQEEYKSIIINKLQDDRSKIDVSKIKKNMEDNLSYTTDLKEAVKDIDLVSESVLEDPVVKEKVYKELSQLAPEKTIFTTNTSTFIPSDLVKFVDRPDKFLALHFANQIWTANIAEIMGHPKTDKKVIEKVKDFAEKIGMVPIVINKEQSGYVINSMLVPWLVAGQALVAEGIADFKDVDKTWMICTGMKQGPCGLIDMVGAETVYHVMNHWGKVLNHPQMQNNAKYLNENFVKKGKIGIKTGEGYYKYPNPEYEQDDFLN